MKLLEGRWGTELKRLLGGTRERLLIISPFVTSVAVSTLRPVVEGSRVACMLITRLNLNDFRTGVSDLAALRELVAMGVEIRTLKGLHAKVYVFDDREAVVTSANFTGGGLANEYEWGMLVSRLECADVFERSDALWGRLRRTLGLGEIDALAVTLDEHRRSHPLAEIDEDELLPDEGEVPTSSEGSALEIDLLPEVQKGAVVTEIDRVVTNVPRFGGNNEYNRLRADLASTAGHSISIRSYLWLVGWCNTGASYGPASRDHVQPLVRSMFGYVPEQHLLVDGRRFDLKNYRYNSRRFTALDDRIVANHQDRLGG